MVGSCGLFTNTRQYYVTCAAGVVLDLAGNAMGALNTAGSWQFRTVNVFSDTVAPEVALVSHVEVVGNLAHGFVIFTEAHGHMGMASKCMRVDGKRWRSSGFQVLGPDFGSGRLPHGLPRPGPLGLWRGLRLHASDGAHGGQQSGHAGGLHRWHHRLDGHPGAETGAGATSRQLHGRFRQEFGMLEYRIELPELSPRRFQLRVPANYVTDTASPTALTGPSAAYAFAFDVGMPYGQEVLPATSTANEI